jgi:hypothetical protein
VLYAGKSKIDYSFITCLAAMAVPFFMVPDVVVVVVVVVVVKVLFYKNKQEKLLGVDGWATWSKNGILLF